ncbi:MAG: AI-2E family transporter [Gemmatimonadota bacterium]
MPDDTQHSDSPGTPPVNGGSRTTRLLTADHADLVRAALMVVFALVGLQLLWAARFLALTAFIGILFGLGATPGVDALERRGLRRGIGSPLIIFGTLALLLSISLWLAPTLVNQSQELRTRFPLAIEKVELWLGSHQPRLLDALAGKVTVSPPSKVTAPSTTTVPTTTTAAPATEQTVGPATGAPPRQGRLVEALYRQGGKLKQLAFGILTSTLAVFGGLVLVVFIAVYVAAEPDVYRRGLLLLFKPRTRARLDPVLTAIAAKLRRWLGTQAIAMLIIGTVTTILMMIIGVRAAVPLGVIAGLFEFIPNIGPTLSAIPAIAMAFADSPEKALVVVVAYWGIQFLENNLLIPYLMKEQLDLPPALTLMTQVVMAYVFGFLGLFVATPLLAAVFVAVQRLYVVYDPVITPAPGMDTVTGTGTTA